MSKIEKQKKSPSLMLFFVSSLLTHNRAVKCNLEKLYYCTIMPTNYFITRGESRRRRLVFLLIRIDNNFFIVFCTPTLILPPTGSITKQFMKQFQSVKCCIDPRTRGLNQPYLSGGCLEICGGL